MTSKLATIDKGAEQPRFVAELRAIGARAYLAGGPIFGLVVVVFAIALALPAIAIRRRIGAV